MHELNINDYKYDLPAERIAIHPLPDRDASKLLVLKDNRIRHSNFKNLVDFLPENSFLFFNDTKVIPARVFFKKETGAEIEVFLLNPLHPSSLITQAMVATDQCTWKCTIGNLKRWPDQGVLEKKIDGITLLAKLIDRHNGLVQFTWNGSASFAEVISRSGQTPLPPYLKRSADRNDRERYQTVYSHFEGAVAAPTAGLHFTQNTFKALLDKKIQHDFLTLHVSAGTFQPVKADNINDHVMHAEQVVVSKKNLENLLVRDRSVVAVGTTSMRTLESIYWFGAKLMLDPEAPFIIEQDYPYTSSNQPPVADALAAVRNAFEKSGKETITGETSIFIKPGYSFKICKGLITNFHQPASTLMLLVAAFVGKNWKVIYNEALKENYRFLSYGDSSLLLP